jgi:hypothetical protein
MESSMEVPKKPKIENPVLSLLGYIHRGMCSRIHRATCTPMFIAALVTRTKLWKQPR